MIAKKANISKSSVSLILRDSVQKKRSIIKPKKIGRPKKLTDRDRRKLIRTINTIRNKDTNFTVQRLLAQSGPLSCEISYRTIYREVKAAGFHFLPVRKKGVVTNGDRSKKAFARECKKLLSTSPNFFTRSIAFYLDGVSFVHKTRPLSNALAPRGRVWRKRSELGFTGYFLVFLVCTEQVSYSVLFSRKRGRKWFIMDNDHLNEALLLAKLSRKNVANYSVFQQDLQT